MPKHCAHEEEVLVKAWCFNSPKGDFSPFVNDRLSGLRRSANQDLG
jgi:hypothetical protein